MVNGDIQWTMEIYNVQWRYAMVNGEVQWLMEIYNVQWRYAMVNERYNGHWRGIMVE